MNTKDEEHDHVEIRCSGSMSISCYWEANIGHYLEADFKSNPQILLYKVCYDLAFQLVSRRLKCHRPLTLSSFKCDLDDTGHDFAKLTHKTQKKNTQGGIQNQMPIHESKFVYTLKNAPKRNICLSIYGKMLLKLGLFHFGTHASRYLKDHTRMSWPIYPEMQAAAEFPSENSN